MGNLRELKSGQFHLITLEDNAFEIMLSPPQDGTSPDSKVSTIKGERMLDGEGEHYTITLHIPNENSWAYASSLLKTSQKRLNPSHHKNDRNITFRIQYTEDLWTALDILQSCNLILLSKDSQTTLLAYAKKTGQLPWKYGDISLPKERDGQLPEGWVREVEKKFDVIPSGWWEKLRSKTAQDFTPPRP